MKTQDDLYQEFLAKTAPLRADFEAKVKALADDLATFRKPFDDQFDTDTADIKAQITPEVEAIDKAHRYACHLASLPIHRKLNKLEKQRLKKLKPIQAKWDALTAAHQQKLRDRIDHKIAEYNALIEQLTTEFNEANKPAHDEYMAEATALDAITLHAIPPLNTPVGEAA